MIQKSHSWAYIQKKLSFQKIHAFPLPSLLSSSPQILGKHPLIERVVVGWVEGRELHRTLHHAEFFQMYYLCRVLYALGPSNLGFFLFKNASLLLFYFNHSDIWFGWEGAIE